MRASEVSTSVMFEAIGVSCMSAPFVLTLLLYKEKAPRGVLVCQFLNWLTNCCAYGLAMLKPLVRSENSSWIS